MKGDKVYVLYEADQWVSKNSLIAMGIFDERNKAVDQAMVLLIDQIERGLHDYDDIDSYLKDAHYDIEIYGLFSGSEASVQIKEVYLNKRYEI